MARRYEPGELESREATLRAIDAMLPETLRQGVVGLHDPVVFGETLRRRFDGQAKLLLKAQNHLAQCQAQQAERWDELRDLKQRNRLLAALLLHSFDEHALSWESGAIDAALDGAKGKDLLLRRDPASGVLHLRAAPKEDPEPWERL